MNVVVLAGTAPTSSLGGCARTPANASSPRSGSQGPELLEVLERSDADRAALISRLYLREDATWLAELLMDLEDEVGEMARLRLIEELRREIRGEGV